MKFRTSLCLALALGSLLLNARADINSGLVLYLPLEETTGNLVHDQSPNAFVGNITNFIGDTQWTPGWITNGLNLNQNPTINQYIRFADDAALNFTNTPTFTIAMWVKFLNSQISGASFIAKGTGGGFEQYDLDWSAAGTGGRYRLVTRQNAGTAITLATGTAAPNNVWQHIAVTCDAVTNHALRMYINGVFNTATTNAGLTSLRGSSHELSIGSRQSAAAAYNLPTTNIVFDEIRLYNRALSASDIAEVFAFNGPVSHGQMPVITIQPRSITNYVGDTAVFSVGTDVNTTPPVSVQWLTNGIPIPGATATTLVVPSVQLTTFAGPYSVVITNIVGVTNSATAFLQVQPITTTNIGTGLMGYWRFDDSPGSSTVADQSGNGNTGTLDSFADYTACWIAGLTNGALYFNTNGLATAGVAAIPAVGVPAPSSLDFSTGGAFTLSAFVNGIAPQTNGGAFFCKGTGNGGEQFAVDLNGGNFRFYVRGTNNGVFINPVATTAVPLNGTWQHVAAVCDCINGIMNIYVNGQLAGAAAAPLSLLTNAHEITLGNRQSSAVSAYNLPFTGAIDEARIYNRALNSAEIQALYISAGTYPPLITVQPQGGSLFVGEDFRFTPVIGGNAPFTYRWKTNGVNAAAPNYVAGGTNLVLTITNVQLFNAADYALSVTNNYGGTNSIIATLQVTNFYVTNNLNLWLKFDDATGLSAVDATPNGNNGSLLNFPGDDSYWGIGRLQGALNFNQTAPPTLQEYVSLPDSPTLNFDTSLKFTLAAWVKGPTVQTNGAAIICKGIGSGGEQYCIDIFNNAYRFFLRNSAAAAPGITPTNAPNNQWQHVAVSVDCVAGFMRMYVNGQLVGTNAAPAALLANSGHEVSIGNRPSPAGVYNMPFTGAMDDVRIYNRALSALDIQHLIADAGVQPPVFYTKPIGSTRYVGDNLTLSGSADGTGPLTYQWLKNGVNLPGATNTTLVLTNLQTTNAGAYSLLVTNVTLVLGSNSTPAAVISVSVFDITNTVGYWKLDDAAGSTAVDSANANNGTLNNMPVDDSEWISGRIAGALNFNADASGDDYVSIPDSTLLNFTNQLTFSIAAWVRGSPTQPSGAGIVAKGTGSGGEQYALDVSAGLYRFYVRNGAAVSTPMVSPVAPNNRWQHLVAVYDGTLGAMRLFVNGQQVASAVAPNSLLGNAHEVSIGNRQSGTGPYNFPFTGAVDDVRIYARSLRTNEVQQIYALATNFGPVFYAQPQSSTNYVHDAVTFSALADGTDPLTYQWRKNGTSIPNATNTSLTLGDLALSDAAAYTLVVSNPIPATNLSSAAVLTVNALPLPDLTNELIAYWNFDETTGANAADSSGRGNSVTLLEFAVDDSEWVPGVISNALHFSSSGAGATPNYRVVTDNPLTFDNGNVFSFSFWAKRDATAPTGSPRFLTPLVAGQTAVVWVPGTGVGPLTPAHSTEPSVNDWHNFVITSDRLAGTYSLFVDGVKQVANAGGYVRADPAAAPQYWVIGHSETVATTTDSFSGYLDDVRVYNRVLNYNDAQALYFNAAQRLGSGQLAYVPSLSKTTTGNSITLSWPRGATGFNLYKSDSLTTPSWTGVTNVPVVSVDGAAFTVTVAMDAAKRFYRLQNP
jgi:hypothetical protein